MIIIFRRFRREPEISPGQTFFLPAAQEANREQLLEILSVAEPVIEELAKVKPETWRTMKGIFTSMERGMSNMFGQPIARLKGAAMSPFNLLSAQMSNTMEHLMMPINAYLNSAINSYESWLMRNQAAQTGAAVGTGIGFVLGYVIGMGPWGALLGGAFGSLIGGALGPRQPTIIDELMGIYELGYTWEEIREMEEIEREAILEEGIRKPAVKLTLIRRTEEQRQILRTRGLR